MDRYGSSLCDGHEGMSERLVMNFELKHTEHTQALCVVSFSVALLLPSNYLGAQGEGGHIISEKNLALCRLMDL